jgi:MFS family permease
MKRVKDMVLFPLCQGEHRKSQILFIFDGILINAAVTLTNGVFLSGYMVTLKANDFLVGILNSSGTWALLISLFSFLIFERMERRKILMVTMNIASRVLTCAVVYLPFLIHDNTILLYLTSIMVIAGNMIWSIYSVGVMVWMINLLPNNQTKNRYIYLRMLFLRISFTVGTLIMGLVLDAFNKSLTGFVIVFSVSLVLSIADGIVLMNTYEPVNKIDKSAKKFEMKWFLEPVRNKEYRQFLVFMFGFFFCLYLSSSYTPLYQIKYLDLDYSFLSVINTISYINMILGTQLWNRVESKKGLHYVLGLTALFMTAEFFLYGFMTQKTIFLLFITPFLAGIGNSGFNVATVNYRYSIIPEDGHKTIYEGWYGAVLGLSALLGPIAGNLIRQMLPHVESPMFQYSGFQFMYLISFALAAIVIYLMFYRRGKKRQERLD